MFYQKRNLELKKLQIYIHELLFLLSGEYQSWSKWSTCSANCSLNQRHGVKTRSRTFELNSQQQTEFQEMPCDGFCPPGAFLSFTLIQSSVLESYVFVKRKGKTHQAGPGAHRAKIFRYSVHHFTKWNEINSNEYVKIMEYKKQWNNQGCKKLDEWIGLGP